MSEAMLVLYDDVIRFQVVHYITVANINIIDVNQQLPHWGFLFTDLVS